jgi:hypothetical protein
VPARLVFRCEHCGVEPDLVTQTSLERQLLHQRFGEYVDAGPGGWLVWSGRGIYGRPLYACGDHRGELTAFVRQHYGTLGPHPWSMQTYPSLPPDDDAIARRRMQMAAVPKFGFG